MPTDGKIDYVELPANNLDSVQSFYSQAFGWTFTDFGPEYRAFSDGKVDGGFYKSDLHSSTGTGAALVILYTKDLKQVRSKVIANGGKIVREIFSFPGGRRFHFADPNGNELAVWSEQ
jgi:predicted enzyme related to lactoylglutathione lyase